MEEKNLEKRKNIEIVILVVIVVLLIGALIYLLFIRKDNTTEQFKPQDSQEKDNDKSV